MVEHWTENPGVGGSNPPLTTIFVSVAYWLVCVGGPHGGLKSPRIRFDPGTSHHFNLVLPNILG